MPDVAWSEASFVKVNRIRDSYTWNVQVAAKSDSLEDLEVAKDKAILVSRELEQEFSVHPPREAEEMLF